MFRRVLFTSILGCVLTGSLMWADEVVRVAPPRPLVERRAPPPAPGYVWTPGYHRWNGRSYVWTNGQWIRPPHSHAKWVAGHWVRRGHGWTFVEGHWR